jgi:hypothetical protein
MTKCYKGIEPQPITETNQYSKSYNQEPVEIVVIKMRFGIRTL